VSPVPTGPVTVTETGPTGYIATDISADIGACGTPDLAGKTVTCTLVGGQLTEVVFTNATAPPPPTTGTLIICKVLAPGTIAPADTLFTFSIAGQASVALTAGTCAVAGTFAAGSVQVCENALPGFKVTDISYINGSGTVAIPCTTATILSGLVTRVQFTNGNFDFRIIISPNSQSVSRTGTAVYTVTVISLGGFTAPVTLTSTFPVPNATLQLTPNVVTPPGTATMTVRPSKKTTTGTYAITVTGTSGGLTHTASAILTVTLAHPK
jgi:hypothetical protein